MFRRILHHPQGELLSLAQNYLLIVMLHWLQSIRYIMGRFYNVVYDYLMICNQCNNITISR
jgi:hypothetical protein